jgi:alpha-D-ribose 1-methylphosphonate 5-triphosphate diphosphatase PhnM
MWLLEKNMDKVEWIQFSRNPAAIHLLQQNLETVDWDSLSSNSNPNAVHLLKDALNHSPEKINWSNLSRNPNFMEVIGELDYEAMKKAIQPLAEELAQWINDPRRYESPEEFIERQIVLGFRDDDTE